MKHMLADIKFQQNESLQQQKVFCNSCKKYASKLLEKTMKRWHLLGRMIIKFHKQF
jgi:hypothetical protein